jgi:hypothetical protein
VQLRGKRTTEGVKVVAAALLTLRRGSDARAKGIAARKSK